MTAASDAPEEYRQPAWARPPGACEIILVRHGESEPWRHGADFPMVDGHGDPRLDPNGVRQARLVGARLATEDIAAIYVSTLRRTVETAAPLAAALGIDPVVEADLREVHLGAWEGGSFRKHVADGHPIAQQMSDEGRWDVIPDAEPGAAFATRVGAVVERIASRHPDQCVAVFTHGGVIAQAMALATGARLFAFLSDNAAITRIVRLDGRMLVRGYNDIDHLHRPGLA